MNAAAGDYAMALHELSLERDGLDLPLVQRFMRRLVRDHNYDLLPLIIEELVVIADREQNKLVVEVTTAHQLNDEQREAIKKGLLIKYPESAFVELQETVLPELIGGVRLKIEETVIDHTVKAKLDKLVVRP